MYSSVQTANHVRHKAKSSPDTAVEHRHSHIVPSAFRRIALHTTQDMKIIRFFLQQKLNSTQDMNIIRFFRLQRLLTTGRS